MRETPVPRVETLLPRGKEWNPVHSGESGDRLYRRGDGAVFAKLSTGAGTRVLAGERRRTEWLAAAGIGSPIVLDWRDSDDGACLVTSAVPGVPASALSSALCCVRWTVP